jgi:hypothetical protein
VIDQSTDGFLLGFDQIPAGFSMLALDKCVAHRPDAPSDAVSRFEHRDLCSSFVQLNSSCEPRKASARNDDGPAAQEIFAPHCQLSQRSHQLIPCTHY